MNLHGKSISEGEGASVPDRDITYSQENKEPDWKIDWDQARDLCRRGLFGQALVQYELVLQKKSTVDVARWEYATLLMRKQRWQQAGKELDTLLAHEPDLRKFLLARAKVYLQEGQLEQTVQLYRRLHRNPLESDTQEVLVGLITALERQGNTKEQLPLLEELVALNPGDPALVKQLAELTLEVGDAEKVSRVLAVLSQLHSDDVEVFRLVARSFDALDQPEQAAASWQQVVALDPADAEANEWLVKYYQKNGNIEMALLHIERQLKRDPGRVELLLVAAHLYVQIDKPGRSLDYLNVYLDLVPDDQNIISERDDIRKVLASDLVTLVEYTDVKLLWQDLEKVTRDRAGVYVQMADLLRAEGKKRELAEVLLLLHKNNADTPLLFKELASLLKEQGRGDELN